MRKKFSEEPWVWVGDRALAWIGRLLMRWVAGTIFGVVMNVGVFVGAAASALVIYALGDHYFWTDAERHELWLQSAWVWAPLGWYAAGKILAADKGGGLLNMFRDTRRGPEAGHIRSQRGAGS
jgi:hypothetical protein